MANANFLDALGINQDPIVDPSVHHLQDHSPFQFEYQLARSVQSPAAHDKRRTKEVPLAATWGRKQPNSGKFLSPLLFNPHWSVAPNGPVQVLIQILAVSDLQHCRIDDSKCLEGLQPAKVHEPAVDLFVERGELIESSGNSTPTQPQLNSTQLNSNKPYTNIVTTTRLGRGSRRFPNTKLLAKNIWPADLFLLPGSRQLSAYGRPESAPSNHQPIGGVAVRRDHENTHSIQAGRVLVPSNLVLQDILKQRHVRRWVLRAAGLHEVSERSERALKKIRANGLAKCCRRLHPLLN